MTRMEIRKASERGHADFGWLDSRHSFSFGNYYDPKHMGFSALRVINDDRVVGGAGFPTHPHRDMEILSYVLEGALEHRDSMGHGGVVGPGDVQYMSAGRGVTHSEYNPSKTDPLRFLQIWIVPNVRGEAPDYQSLSLSGRVRGGPTPVLIASSDGRDESIRIKQDVNLYASRLGADESTKFVLGAGRNLWLQVARGRLSVAIAESQSIDLEEGDGAAISAASHAQELTLQAGADGEVLLFDLP
jgi:redox-sensitive bicupin YhaK (pirin superfamily)